MSEIAFESLETNSENLLSRLFSSNLFSTISCIFICSFRDIHLSFTNYNSFWFCNRLLTFSTHFYPFTKRFCSFLLVYQSFLLVSTRLPFISFFYSFASRFYSFLIIYQTFLIVYQSFQILVLTQKSYPTSNINKIYCWKILKFLIK